MAALRRRSAQPSQGSGPRAWGRSLALMGVAAGGLAAVLYAAVLSFPVIDAGVASDPVFGRINACLLGSLGGSGLGFAVAPDAQAAASYGDAAVAVCSADGRSTRFSMRGVQAATFDGKGGLWLAGPPPGLWRIDRPSEASSIPRQVGSFNPVALAGVVDGVLAIDGSGRILAITPDGRISAEAPLPGSTGESGPSLSVAPGGGVVAVVVGGALGLYRPHPLERLRWEAPCDVRRALWAEEASRLLLQCSEGPERWFLWLDTETGASTLARPDEPSIDEVRLYGRPLSVRRCDALPCSATPRRGGAAP